MSERAATQVSVPRPAQPAPKGLLQRACACGGHAGLDGECAACRKKRLQRRLAIGASSNRYEREADAIAARAMAGSPPPQIGRIALGTLQRAAELPETGAARPSVDAALAGAGQPLDPATRGWAEARLGHDFGRVRVHTGPVAARSARAVGALAYTVGQQIVFGAGQYRPHALEGQRLLAHELTHTVQQRDLAQSGPLRIGPRDDAAEREASRVARGGGAITSLAGEAYLRRVPESAKSESYDEVSAREIARGLRNLICAVRTVDPVRAPLTDMSTLQSPGASGWRGAIYGKYRNGCTRWHRGWDIHAPEGTPVYAVVAGRLSRHTEAGGLGNFVRLTSAADNRRAYLYAHLSAREPAGDVCVGDKVGETGVSGNASADRPHLHFQVHQGGTRLDPATLLTMPTMVIEATGSTATAIDFSEPDPC